ncbi:MAG: ADP-ribosylglycohydrolase family protein, partial [Chloroflexota bacterium]
NMALSIYACLRQHQTIDQDALAQSFAEHFDRRRGYGPAMHRWARRVGEGGHWQVVAGEMFDGTGSYGNGGAMQVAPVGAYFADDLSLVVEMAAKSAEITHAHPEGIAGGIAVAVATAIAHQHRDTEDLSPSDFIRLVIEHVPDSEVKSGLVRASDIRTTMISHVVRMIGNGSRISAQDTVPFAVWCAARFRHDFEDAIWRTLSGGGDADTTAAMVGGISAMVGSYDDFPGAWVDAREPLPVWAVGEADSPGA